jgi:ketosteroid isomerase-like protein
MQTENKTIVEKVNAAFDDGNTDAFLSFCADNITWNIIGDMRLTGKEAIKNFMAGTPAEQPQFTVKEIIAEDNSAVCYGDMKMKNKEGVLEDYSFCDIYHFSGGKIAELLTFMAKHKQTNN